MEDVREATVDLDINTETGQQEMILVLDGSRRPISPPRAARLAADLSTVLGFVVDKEVPQSVKDYIANNGSEQEEEDTQDETERPQLRAVEDDTELPRIKWHRVGKGQSKYQAELPDGSKALTYPSPTGKGWNVKIGSRKINSAPISLKREAYELVARVVSSNLSNV